MSLIKNIFSISTATALGAGTMYLLDPLRGRRRRARAVEKIYHAYRIAAHRSAYQLRGLSHRTRGALAEARLRARSRHVDDHVLAERIRAQLGRWTSRPHSIEIHCHEGKVTVRGIIPKNEIQPLMIHISRIPGVHHRVKSEVQALEDIQTGAA